MKRLAFSLLFFFLISAGFAQSKVDSLLSALSKAADDTSKMSLNNDIAWELANSDTKQALEYAAAGLKIAQRLNDAKSLSDCYTVMGSIYANRSDYSNAITYYTKSAEVVPDDKSVRANTLTNLGNVYADMGDEEKSISNYFLALKEFELENDEKGVGISYENIALLYDDQGQHGKAQVFFAKSIAVEKKYNDEVGLSGSYSNMGNMFQAMGKYDSAEAYYSKSLVLAEKTGHKRWESGAYEGLGEVAEAYKNYDEALDWYNKSLVIDRDLINDQQGVAGSCENIGHIYYLKGNYPKAIEMLNNGIKISGSIHAFGKEMDCLEELSKIYAGDKEFEKAYLTHVAFLQLKDSLKTKESSRQIVEMQTKYDTQEKEIKIRMLTQQNQIQDLQINKNQLIIYVTIIGLILLVILALLIYMRYQLKRKANAQLEFQNAQIQQQKGIIEIKNKDITDSIIYAKRIQEAILPPVAQITGFFADSFVLYKPKDIVSGDFYYFQKAEDQRVFLAAVDCTGHGVPGAFMSIVGYNAINQAINEYHLKQPADILNKMNHLLADTLHTANRENSVQDGMDMSLCLIDPLNRQLQFAGAYNSLWIIRNNEFIEYKADKFPVGAFDIEGEKNVFKNNEIALLPGDCMYMFTDGFADQFGGPEGKKFKHKNLKELLLAIQSQDMAGQQQALNNKLEEWKGSLEQVDDILIIGIKIA